MPNSFFHARNKGHKFLLAIAGWIGFSAVGLSIIQPLRPKSFSPCLGSIGEGYRIVQVTVPPWGGSSLFSDCRETSERQVII